MNSILVLPCLARRLSSSAIGPPPTSAAVQWTWSTAQTHCLARRPPCSSIQHWLSLPGAQVQQLSNWSSPPSSPLPCSGPSLACKPLPGAQATGLISTALALPFLACSFQQLSNWSSFLPSWMSCSGSSLPCRPLAWRAKPLAHQPWFRPAWRAGSAAQQFGQPFPPLPCSGPGLPYRPAAWRSGSSSSSIHHWFSPARRSLAAAPTGPVPPAVDLACPAGPLPGVQSPGSSIPNWFFPAWRAGSAAPQLVRPLPASAAVQWTQSSMQTPAWRAGPCLIISTRVQPCLARRFSSLATCPASLSAAMQLTCSPAQTPAWRVGPLAH